MLPVSVNVAAGNRPIRSSSGTSSQKPESAIPGDTAHFMRLYQEVKRTANWTQDLSVRARNMACADWRANLSHGEEAANILESLPVATSFSEHMLQIVEVLAGILKRYPEEYTH